MKFSQVVKLGHQNIAGHKRRSLAAVVTAGILFGVLMAILLVVQGLENAIAHAHDAAISSAPYYLRLSTNLNQCDTEVEFDEDGQIMSSVTTCPQANFAALQSELASYQGELLEGLPEGSLQFWQDVLELPLQLENIPQGASPVLLGARTALDLAQLTPPKNLGLGEQATIIKQVVQPLVGQTFTNGDGKLLYFAGLLPTGDLAEINAVYERGAWHSQGNPVNLLLRLVGASTPELPTGMLYLSQTEPNYISDGQHEMINYETRLLKFENFEAAYRFAEAKVCVDEYGACEFLPEYNIVPLVGNQIQVAYRFQLAKFVLNLVKYVIMLIALIIMLITCIKVIQAEGSTIKLYRGLGASARDLNLIYGAYLLEFCLLTITFALMVGLLIAGIISFSSATALREMLTIAYAQEFSGALALLGWNFSLTQVIIMMLLVAPLGLLICQKTLRQNR